MEEELDIDLREILIIIKKRIKMITIITLITTILGALISIFLISPVYESKVGIIISKKEGEKITSSDVSMYQNLMQTYRDIAGTNIVAKGAAEKLGIEADSSDIRSRTTITLKTGTMILNIGVKNNSGNKAYEEAVAYSESFMKRAKELMPEGQIRIMDNATIPEYPIKPNKKMIVLISFFLGLMGSIGIAFLIQFLNSKLVTKEDVEKYLGLSTIGIIPENDEE